MGNSTAALGFTRHWAKKNADDFFFFEILVLFYVPKMF